MTPTANECLAPASGTGTVAYLQIQGVVTSVQFQTRYRAMVTRNNAPVQSTRTAAVPPGWQIQPLFAQADLAVSTSATAEIPATGELEWRLNVSNKGTGPSHGFQVDDIIPLGVTEVTVASSPIPCTIGTETVDGAPRRVVHCASEPPDCIVVPDPSVPAWSEPVCDVEDRLVPSVLAAGASLDPIVLRGRSGSTAGQVTNAVTVSGADFDPIRSDNTASATTTVVPARPAVTLSASTVPADPSILAPGSTVSYSFTVTNQGNIPLTEVVVADDEWSGAAAAPAIACPSGALATGASLTCTAAYAVTQADIDRGEIRLQAHAVAGSAAGDALSSPVAVTSTLLRSSGLSLEYAATPTAVTAVGQTVTYRYRVTNTGNVSLGQVGVRGLSFSGTGSPPVVTCPARELAPTAAMTCTSTYTVAEGDKLATTLSSAATASATAPVGVADPSATADVDIEVVIPVPGVALTGAVDDLVDSEVVPGAQLQYEFRVSNTGNTALAPVSATFARFTGFGPRPEITCDPPPLNVARDLSCRATYALTQSDIDAGTVTAAARADADSAGGSVSSDSAVLTSTLARTAALALRQVGAPSTVTRVGTVVSLEYAVTNTGNTTLTALSFSQQAFTGLGSAPTVTCPSTELIPAQTVTCTASYTVVDADVPSTALRSTVTAQAVAPAGVPSPESPSSTVTILLAIADLTFAKSANRSEADPLAEGDTITYSLTVANTGGAPLESLSIEDDLSAVLEGARLEGAPRASIDGSAASSPVVSGDELTWSGALAAGKVLTITYMFTVGSQTAELRNDARVEATTSSAPTILRASASTRHIVLAPEPTDPVGPPVPEEPLDPGEHALSSSGVDPRASGALALVAAALILAGSSGLLFDISRRRRTGG